MESVVLIDHRTLRIAEIVVLFLGLCVLDPAAVAPVEVNLPDASFHCFINFGVIAIVLSLVGDQQREDVLNSLLLAQLVANRQSNSFRANINNCG